MVEQIEEERERKRRKRGTGGRQYKGRDRQRLKCKRLKCNRAVTDKTILNGPSSMQYPMTLTAGRKPCRRRHTARGPNPVPPRTAPWVRPVDDVDDAEFRREKRSKGGAFKLTKHPTSSTEVGEKRTWNKLQKGEEEMSENK